MRLLCGREGGVAAFQRRLTDACVQEASVAHATLASLLYGESHTADVR